MPTMQLRHPTAQRLAAGGLAVIGGAGWYGFLMRRIWAATAYGPICGHASGMGLHCPACYGALALILLGFGVLAADTALSAQN
jgi:hypothetical protein